MFKLPAYDPTNRNAGIWHLGRLQPAVHFLIWVGRNNAKSHFLFGSGFDRRGGNCLGVQFGAGSRLSGQSRLAWNEPHACH